MRLRFLAVSDPSFNEEVALQEKKRVNVEEDGLSAEQIQKRNEADQEFTCYVSLGKLSSFSNDHLTDTL
jgi:hypothetical protein